jgi:hypothetical protein
MNNISQRVDKPAEVKDIYADNSALPTYRVMRTSSDTLTTVRTSPVAALNVVDDLQLKGRGAHRVVDEDGHLITWKEAALIMQSRYYGRFDR